MGFLSIAGKNAFYVSACFRIRWNPQVFVYRAFASIVGGCYESHIATKVCKQPAQIGEPSAYVLFWIEGFADIEPRGSFWNQLHETLGILD